MSRLDLKTSAITATVPMTIGDSEGGIATGAGSVWLMIDKKRNAGAHRSCDQ